MVNLGVLLAAEKTGASILLSRTSINVLNLGSATHSYAIAHHQNY
ncbi:hypothetical protein [Okeania sp. SIO2C9]|nr:hypothetical protein [Okeania sp. SIO2C9]